MLMLLGGDCDKRSRSFCGLFHEGRQSLLGEKPLEMVESLFPHTIRGFRSSSRTDLREYTTSQLIAITVTMSNHRLIQRGRRDPALRGS